MTEKMGDALMFAAIPSARRAAQFRQAMLLPSGAQDIYLAYADGCGCRFAGFLVCARGSINQLIAHCPVSVDLEIGSGMWRREFQRQRETAIHIASHVIKPGRSMDAIWLYQGDQTLREIPTWVFSLSCVPLTFAWDGRLLHPRPFCPKLFESMAVQPEAPRWILQRMNRDRIGGTLATMLDPRENQAAS